MEEAEAENLLGGELCSCESLNVLILNLFLKAFINSPLSTVKTKLCR